MPEVNNRYLVNESLTLADNIKMNNTYDSKYFYSGILHKSRYNKYGTDAEEDTLLKARVRQVLVNIRKDGKKGNCRQVTLLAGGENWTRLPTS